MAKKKINIILIVVVLALWGTVGYRALNRQFAGNEMILEKQSKLDNATINQINKDTFELEKINRDPFLNKQFQTAVAVPRTLISHYKAVKKIVTPIVPKGDPNLQWPNLSYHGYIASKERNEDLVLLTIDSKLRKLKLNDPVNGLIVKKRYKDSIEVYFNSETRMIHLK
ncbi:hypothetical protein [Flavobacterium sp. MDT1-60]|uniref:hypothetical protein n=1 Tax=Flavobacterium sp. MDT1-60 TaxID=1979344 RepID=UPI001783DC46|nr:hypothetical protein [Flavobacterium sp. MDT1-60]QOG02184.1 hypothetical protein IHE43_20685 [Flavobacterium sp. MDT1-60]